MRHFIIALLTGSLYAVLGAGALILIVSTTAGIDLSCRDCQGAAGLIFVILLGGMGGLFVFGLFIGAVASFYFQRHVRANRKIALTLSGVFLFLTALVFGYFGFVKWSVEKNLRDSVAMQKAQDDYLAGLNVQGGEEFPELTKAISMNDSLKVAALLDDSTSVSNIYLQYALDLNFNYQHKISFSILKNLKEHSDHPNWKDYTFDPVMLCTRECDTTLLSLLLKAEAPLLSESGFYPTCADNLALLLKHGVDVNTKIPATDYPYSTATMPQSVRDNPNAVMNTNWTMVMKYANNYPEYINETKLLIARGADLTYKDANGESLHTIVDELIKIYSSPTEAVPQDLLELKNLLEKNF